MTSVDLIPVDAIIARCGRGPEACIPILQAIQDHYHYLPTPALERVCRLTDITPAQITGVASFYSHFRTRPSGQHIIRICHGTACHVHGSQRVQDALARSLQIIAPADTSPDGQFTLERVACLGCCTLAPVLQIDQLTFGHQSGAAVPQLLADFAELSRTPGSPAGGTCMNPQVSEGSIPGAGVEFRVGLGSCCIAKGSQRVFDAVAAELHHLGAQATLKRVGCVGMCYGTPLLEVIEPAGRRHVYESVTIADVISIVRRHAAPKRLTTRFGLWIDRTLDRLAAATPAVGSALAEQSPRSPREWQGVRVNPPAATTPLMLSLADQKSEIRDHQFLSRQVRIATEHFGQLDPLDFDEYQRGDGLDALKRYLAVPDPTGLIATITASGLRGRGGAGFPTGRKWELVRAAPGTVKYVIANGDEGDPGAFMDRMLLESFPYRIIEGLMLAALAVGARAGFFYIRAEYPLAVQRIAAALDQCRQRGLLTQAGLEISIRQGAGAFVCGEETALIASLEGRRGTPRLRPPFPAQDGLWHKPTLVNNVETLAMVPWIVRHGPAAFAAYGTARSKGTKVFALAGKVQRGGLIEVPMGITLRQIVEDLGGGVDHPEGVGGKEPGTSSSASAGDPSSSASPWPLSGGAPGPSFKAVQIGGPSGGCIPAELADTPIDFEALASLGAIMGSGGLVVLDRHDCMVDIARYFLAFTQDQSCGHCTFCRIGTRRMLEILERLCAGQARPPELLELETLAHQIRGSSLCGLGKTAPNPVLTTLRYFRGEYEAHLQGRCPAGRCKALIRYRITDRCDGCTLCAQQCPDQAIPLTPYRVHRIDQSRCSRCDTCRIICPIPGAVVVESGLNPEDTKTRSRQDN